MDLSTVKLKKVTTKEAKPTTHSDSEAKEYEKSVFDTNVDQWYTYLEPYTIKSWFIPLTQEDAKIMRKFYLFKEKKGTPLDDSEKKAIEVIESKIDNIMKLIPSEKGAFVRCSTRSPKDSHVSIARCKEILLRELDPSSSANDKLKALLKASLGGMKALTASEAMELLCSSERIYEDFGSEIEKPNFHQLIIIREWVDIEIQHEYRGFVCNNSLNAISQYYHTIYFSDLASVWDTNIALIRTYFDSIKHIIPLKNYIIDFAVLNDSKILVIELNPFGIATDSNNFSWIEDKAVLTDGPFEARITPAPLPVTSGVEIAIQELLNG